MHKLKALNVQTGLMECEDVRKEILGLAKILAYDVRVLMMGQCIWYFALIITTFGMTLLIF